MAQPKVKDGKKEKDQPKEGAKSFYSGSRKLR